MRIAIVGYGAVAALHARQLGADAGVSLVAVCGPDAGKAKAFARTHGMDRVVDSVRDLGGVADAVVICSPSPCHFEQARSALQAGLSVLVELPACASHAEASELAALAADRDLRVRCAHTSRYMEQNQRLGQLLAQDALGPIQQIQYVRTFAPRTRSWADDALLHHLAHPLHLLLHWFPGLRFLGCATHPQTVGARQAAVLGTLDTGAPFTLSVSYDARIQADHLVVFGERHAFRTDGFGRIECDLAAESWEDDDDVVYHAAIRAQDLDFVRACRGEKAGVLWSETLTLAAAIDRLRELADSARSGGCPSVILNAVKNPIGVPHAGRAAGFFAGSE